MYSFDKGRIVATTQDGLVTEFRQPQSFSADFKVNLKDLYGRGQDAIYIASGKRSIDIKGEFADITSSSMNLLLGGTETTGINKIIDPAPVLQVPVTSPYTASLGTIPNGGVLSNLMVVYDVTNAALAIPMTLIMSGTPTSGQFTFASTAVAGARVYTVGTNFVANDTVTINGVTFTAVASSATGNEFLVGSTVAISITNLATVMAVNSTIAALYTITSNATTFTLAETLAGGGNTPTAATVVGTGVITSAAPTTSLATNTFTFAAADTGHNVQVIYKYNIATGTTITLANNLMGSQKPYQLEMFTQLAGAQIHIVFPRVMSAGTSFGAKMEDFTIPSIEAKAMATVADITGYLYLDDNVAQ